MDNKLLKLDVDVDIKTKSETLLKLEHQFHLMYNCLEIKLQALPITSNEKASIFQDCYDLCVSYQSLVDYTSDLIDEFSDISKAIEVYKVAIKQELEELQDNILLNTLLKKFI